MYRFQVPYIDYFKIQLANNTALSSISIRISIRSAMTRMTRMMYHWHTKESEPVSIMNSQLKQAMAEARTGILMLSWIW